MRGTIPTRFWHRGCSSACHFTSRKVFKERRLPSFHRQVPRISILRGGSSSSILPRSYEDRTGSVSRVHSEHRRTVNAPAPDSASRVYAAGLFRILAAMAFSCPLSPISGLAHKGNVPQPLSRPATIISAMPSGPGRLCPVRRRRAVTSGESWPYAANPGMQAPCPK